MNSRDFCYWLMGDFELNGVVAISEEKAQVIKKHLDLVFKHEIDPSYGDKDHQNALSKIHSEKPSNFPGGATLRC